MQLTEEQINNMDMAELWETYLERLLEENLPNEKKMKKDKEEIENGITIKGSIWYFINEDYYPKRKSGEVIFPDNQNGKKCKTEELMQEMANRKILMKKNLKESIIDEDIMTPRA